MAADPRLQRADAALLRVLADNVPAAIAYYENPSLGCVFANRQYAQSNGWTVDSILGRHVREVVGEEAYRLIEPQIERVLRGERVTYVRPLTLPAGELRQIEVDLIPHAGELGGVIGTFVLIIDITRHHANEQAIRDSEERMRKFAHATTEGIFFHHNGILTDVNDALLAITGHTRQEMIGRNTLEFVPEDGRQRVTEYIRAGSEFLYECDILHRDGRRVPVEMIGKTVHRGGETYRLGVLRDISERRRAEAHIRHLARHDALTGLPNRSFLAERLEGMLALARRHDVAAAILFIDLDNFKTVNDSLGHHAGDQLLREVAARLKGALREADLVARLGGDEFLVALAELGSADDATQVAAKLLEVIGMPIEVDGQAVTVTPSIGISLFPRDGSAVDDLIRHADAAMYCAKEGGRAGFRFYRPDLAQSLPSPARDATLRDAVARGEFELHYQPQFELAGGALAGIEALLRWRHPRDGLVAPADFIAFAETRGLIIGIGRWALGEACRQRRAWGDAGLAAGIPVSVNISPSQFRRASLVEEVGAALEAAALAPGELMLELPEACMVDDEVALAHLAGLRALGVRIALDNFGAGYSSLARLDRHPVDQVKVHRDIVERAARDAAGVALAEAVLGLARVAGRTVLAGGVERDAELAFARRAGCALAQGYLTGAPLPAAEFAAAHLRPAGPPPA